MTTNSFTSSSSSRTPGERNIAESITPNSRNNENKILVAVEFFHEGQQKQQHPPDSGPHKQQS